MECAESLLKNNASVRLRSVIKYRHKILYAGLMVCFVPSVLCGPDWSRSRHLTFPEIYNDTNYVQLQHRPRPYDLTEYSFNIAHTKTYNEDYVRPHSNTYNVRPNSNTYNGEDDIRGNELEYDEENSFSGFDKEPLLVGFSHDPFRYSIPEDDYLKGVRDMTPKSILNKGENRGKRGVLHLYNMMYCATGCEPLSYKGYGCYCGFLGSGRPTDGIDLCCKMHDECYETLHCPFFTVYFQPYYWKCHKGQPLCALENHQTRHQFINGCAARLCECDRRFAMCLKRYRCPRRRALCHSSPIRLLQNLLMFR